MDSLAELKKKVSPRELMQSAAPEHYTFRKIESYTSI